MSGANREASESGSGGVGAGGVNGPGYPIRLIVPLPTLGPILLKLREDR
jgi:hypothetical protein